MNVNGILVIVLIKTNDNIHVHFISTRSSVIKKIDRQFLHYDTGNFVGDVDHSFNQNYCSICFHDN